VLGGLTIHVDGKFSIRSDISRQTWKLVSTVVHDHGATIGRQRSLWQLELRELRDRDRAAAFGFGSRQVENFKNSFACVRSGCHGVRDYSLHVACVIK
jgi:hypothetical protein